MQVVLIFFFYTLIFLYQLLLRKENTTAKPTFKQLLNAQNTCDSFLSAYQYACHSTDRRLSTQYHHHKNSIINNNNKNQSVKKGAYISPLSQGLPVFKKK